MKILPRVVSSEISHFNKLGKDGKNLQISYFLFNLTNPILSTFINAFLWRESANIELVVLYNFANFFGLPIGFYLNGKLLRYIIATKLFLAGCVLQGMIALLVMFMPHPTYLLITLLGVIFGITSSFFWANKSLLSMHVIASNKRLYFSSIENMGSSVISVVIPFVVGWFIVFGQGHNLYSVQIAYKVLGFFAVAVLFFAGYIIRNIPLKKVPINHIVLSKPSRRWQRIRITIFLMGMYNGAEIALSALMALIFIGPENSLGEIQAIGGIVLAVTLYQVAKKIDQSYRYHVLSVGIVLSIIASGLFGIFYSAFGVICFFIINAFSNGFRWATTTPMCFDVIDEEEKIHAKHRYSYIYDQQLYLNIGRNLGLTIFFVLFATNHENALRIAPLLFATPQILILWLVNTVEKGFMAEEVQHKTLLFNYVRNTYYR